MFVSHVPRNGTPSYNYSGAWFDVYVNGADEDPIMQPQQNNTYWLGRSGFQFWRVYSNQIYANGVLITSDARKKENFKELNASLDRVMKLKPFMFDYKFTADENVSDNINRRGEEAGKNQIGFKAQDMIEDFPHLVVYDEEADIYSVNYIGLIPELVAALKEQNEVIEELKDEIEMVKGNCCNGSSSSSLNSGSIPGGSSESSMLNQDMQKSSLMQNKPNPFYKETTINYYLSENSKEATLYVYDMNGRQLDKFELKDKGNQSLKISKNSLQAGMYYYSLLVDGEEIATKKMILTE